ncbi:MAG: DNA polymerase Y family protein [Pirellulaceae bacterium]
MKRVACIHFPNWPIQRLVTTHPELRFQRIVLLEQHPQRGQIVTGVSPKAQQAGVRIGIPVTEAKSLLRRNRDSAASAFHVLPQEPKVDRAALEDLARELDAFSPLIGTDNQPAPDSLMLDLSGLAHLFNGEENLLQQLRQHLLERNYVPQIALANTVGAAWALAHFHHSQAPSETTGTIWEQVDALPPAALRLEPSVCETLHLLGLKTIGALRQIPAESLASRFGDCIRVRLQQLAGEVSETFRAIKPSIAYSAEQLLDYPVREQSTVLVVIERLIDRVCRELKSIRQGALAWNIQLWRSEASPLHLRVGLFQASARTEQIIPLVKMQLEQHPDYDGWSFPVEEVGVAASGCVPIVEQQGNLFDDTPRRDETALGELLNRLAIRLGENNVLSAACVAGAQPERAVDYRPLVGPRSIRPRKSNRVVIESAMSRPARLLPNPIELIPESPIAENILPATFSCEDGNALQPFQIVRNWGPERIETGWWNGRTVRRDYWRVETNSGAHLWVFRELRSRRWFLHGAF